MDIRNKIIFLDIDGVLNAPGDNDLIKNTISRKRIKDYKKIIRKTNAYTVIISSRKHYKDDRKVLSRIFNRYRIKHEYISTEYTYLKRADEIKKYIMDKWITIFCILDDNDFKYTKDQLLKDSFIKVELKGLSIDELDIIKDKLKVYK